MYTAYSKPTEEIQSQSNLQLISETKILIISNIDIQTAVFSADFFNPDLGFGNEDK